MSPPLGLKVVQVLGKPVRQSHLRRALLSALCPSHSPLNPSTSKGSGPGSQRGGLGRGSISGSEAEGGLGFRTAMGEELPLKILLV